jgi:hypothetical protein
MDSASYPLVDLYCEDNITRKIIQKAISSIQNEKSLINFCDLINIIISGSADNTYAHFKSHKDTYPFKRIKTGYACILDGDRRLLKDNTGILIYSPEECLHFIYSNDSPEKFLTAEYLNYHPNSNLAYHLTNSNPHILFEKMIEYSGCISKEDAFEKCWEQFLNTSNGQIYFEELKAFILNTTKKFSPDL